MHNFLPLPFYLRTPPAFHLSTHICLFNSTTYPLSIVTDFIQFSPCTAWTLWFITTRTLSTFKTFLSHFLPDITPNGGFLRCSLHHCSWATMNTGRQNELLQAYHIQSQGVTYLTCFLPNQCFCLSVCM